jgi:serine/threonine-protein kinase
VARPVRRTHSSMHPSDVRQTLDAAIASRYAIEREIGAGGMATVYLARDVKHERQVALKVLNPELGAVLGVERFLSEIRVTANLQHPNLLPLFDSGEASGLLYYVMPFVEGESLRARLERERQLPIDEAIRIAVLVASALDYAHGQGVIHRDLKPENILLSRGQPLVADFGIALAVSLAGGARVTQTGLSLGTPQYMSPEQATGDRQIDARTDVYSLAAVLYEMLTGDPPHTASTVQAIIAKVLTERPASVRASRPNVPEYVESAIAAALEKLPADRIASAGEFARALEGKSVALPPAYAAATRLAVTAQIVPATWGERVREPFTAALIALVVLTTAAAVWGWNRGAPPPTNDAPAVRFNLDVPEAAGQLAGGPRQLAVSPDGRYYVYRASVGGTAATTSLMLRASNADQAIRIPGTDGADAPTFSPDGRVIAFVASGQLRTVSLDGFRGSKIADLAAGSLGAWVTRDTMLVAFPALSILTTTGGAPKTLTTLDTTRGERAHTRPYVAPDGVTVFFAIADARSAAARIGTVSLKTGTVTRLDIGGVPLGVIDNHLIHLTDAGTILATPYDLARNTVAGPGVVVADSIMPVGNGASRFGAAALSRSGTLLYLSGVGGTADLIALAIDGTSRTLLTRRANEPRYSPNGRRIAFSVPTDSSDEVWVYDLASKTLDPFARDGRSFRPEWTPDGKRILYNRTVNGKEELWWKASDGTGDAQLLQAGLTHIPEGIISDDGQYLIYRRGSPGSSDADIWYRRLTGDTTSHPIANAKGFDERSPDLSHDGRWIAYSSRESGEDKIYARAFPGPSARFPVSLNRASEPVWSPDGRTLYYREGTTLVAASIVTTPEFTVTNRKTISADIRSFSNANHRGYDIASDGLSFLMTRPSALANAKLVVIHNWAADVRARLSKGSRPP